MLDVDWSLPFPSSFFVEGTTGLGRHQGAHVEGDVVVALRATLGNQLKRMASFFRSGPQKTGVFLVETKILRSIPPETNMVSEKRPPGKGDSYSKPSFWGSMLNFRDTRNIANKVSDYPWSSIPKNPISTSTIDMSFFLGMVELQCAFIGDEDKNIPSQQTTTKFDIEAWGMGFGGVETEMPDWWV